MERYCLLHNWKLDDFQKQDKDKCIDVNYRSMVEQVKEIEDDKTKKMIWNNYLKDQNNKLNELGYNIIHREIKSYLDGVDKFISEKLIDSYECELDITEESVLILVKLKEDEESLFQWNSNVNKSHMLEICVNTMKQTIGNIRDGKGKTEKIFDVSDISTTKEKAKIKSFGCDIVRLWLISKDFRNLFTYTVSRNEKYKLNSILNIVDSAQEYGIPLKLEECIILEKLLGIQTWMSFCTWIYPYISNEEGITINGKTLNVFLETIMKYEGNNVRCAIIQNIGNILKHIQDGFRNYLEDSLVKMITVILEKNVEYFNDLYRNTANRMLKQLAKIYTAETALERMLQKRKELNKVGNSWMGYDYNVRDTVFSYYLEQIIKSYEKSDMIDRFMSKLCGEKCKDKCPFEDEKDISLKKIENQRQKLGKEMETKIKLLCDFYKENNFGLYYSELCDIDKKIFRKMGEEQGNLGSICQKEIINANYKKYSEV